MTPFLFFTSAFVLIWILLFIATPETRREQILMTLVGALAAPAVFIVVSTRYFVTSLATQQTFAFSNIVFMAVFFGVASVLYEASIGRSVNHHIKKNSPHFAPLATGVGLLVILLGIIAFITLLLMLVFNLSPIMSLTVGITMIGLYIVAEQKKLRIKAVLTGAFLMGLLFIVEQVTFASLFPDSAQMIWNPNAISGLFIGAVPIEELVWATATGFAIGPLYEYVRSWKAE